MQLFRPFDSCEPFSVSRNLSREFPLRSCGNLQKSPKLSDSSRLGGALRCTSPCAPPTPLAFRMALRKNFRRSCYLRWILRRSQSAAEFSLLWSRSAAVNCWGVVQPVGHHTVNVDGEGSNPSAPATSLELTQQPVGDLGLRCPIVFAVTLAPAPAQEYAPRHACHRKTCPRRILLD